MKTLESVLSGYRKGWSLEQEFFTSNEVFKADIEHIWMKKWLFAGFTSEIPNPGDYFVYNVLNDSIIIIRGDENKIFAHHNTCRHRGSAICTEEKGNTKYFICPYHSWVYEKNGNLKNARMMPEGFDKSKFGLHAANLEIVEGVIFISLSDNPPSFNEIANELGPFLKPFQFGRSKVAYRDRYELNGNWKLIAENFRECYHCGPTHPEYCKAVDTSNLMEDEDRVAYLAISEKEWAQKGLAVDTVDFRGNSSHYAIRYPLQEGFESYSLDGNPVSSIMGSHQDHNNGVVGLVTLPNCWMDCVSDYVWALRITPIDATHCMIDTTFLVDGDAVEGKDYELEKLTAFWSITAGQDWKAITNNQKGIESGRYAPGPYSPPEVDTAGFDQWYIDCLRGGNSD